MIINIKCTICNQVLVTIESENVHQEQINQYVSNTICDLGHIPESVAAGE